MKDKVNEIKSGIIGFIVGDALGVPLEFVKRERLQKNKVTKMLGYGSHAVPRGSWSDDTSMTLATIDAMIADKDIIDYCMIMDNFLDWVESAKYTPHNEVFDIGRTVLQALRNYSKDKNPMKSGINSINSNGNGSLMRILPFVYYSYYNKLEDFEIYKLIKDVSSFTHSHEISVLGCFIYTLFCVKFLEGKEKEEAYHFIKQYDYNMYFTSDTIFAYNNLLNDNIESYSINNINSSGYIIHTLEAVFWCFLNNVNYKDSVLEAINLGNDTDTIGALVGGLSGIYYGYEQIPKNWINVLAKKEYVLVLCSEFAQCF